MDVVLIVIIVVAFIVAVRGLRMVQQATVIVVERLGKYNRTLEPGLHFIVPFVDSIRPILLDGRFRGFVELREQVMDFPPQAVITHDNVTMQVDSVIYFQINNPIKAIYEIENLTVAIRQLAITNLRNIMGELDLDQTLTSRETVNAKLRAALDDATDKWGVKVSRVELKNIAPPNEIEEAMAKQMKAERERRAVVTEAEGFKRSQVLRAEGERDAKIAEAEGRRQYMILESEGNKRSQVLRAEGEAEAIKLVNAAQAEATRMVFSAIHDGNPSQDLIAIKYIEALEAISRGQANKVFIPYEAMSVLGGLGAIKEMLTAQGPAAPAAKGPKPANQPFSTSEIFVPPVKL